MYKKDIKYKYKTNILNLRLFARHELSFCLSIEN